MEDATEDSKILKCKVSASSFSRCKVDIVIPFHGQYDKVSRLIYSIILSAKSNPYQITLVDDGSPNKKFSGLFKDFDNKRPYGTEPILKFVKNENRLGFAQSLLVGYNATKQPWIMFMHSDCIVEDPQWMIEMGRSLLSLKDKKVRMVSPRCQKAVSGVTSKIVGKKGEKTGDYILQDGFLPLFCVMCHRDLFQHVGGFIKNYPTYEDEEFAYRMNHFGYKQAICGGSFVHHEGGGTYGPLVKTNPEVLQEMDFARERALADLRMIL